MGLSSDPEKRQRQLDALAEGRRRAAENLISTGNRSRGKPGREPGRAGASPVEPGRAPAKPRKSKAERRRYTEREGAKPREKRNRAPRERRARKPAEPTRAERRGPLARFVDGFLEG